MILEVDLLTHYYSGSKANTHPFTGGDEADNWEPFHTGSSGRIFNEIHELICLPSQLSDTDVKQRSLRVTRAEAHRTHRRIGNGCLAQPALVGFKPQYPNQAVRFRGNPTTSLVWRKSTLR